MSCGLRPLFVAWSVILYFIVESTMYLTNVRDSKHPCGPFAV
jgi:hypothetical protein